MYSSTLPLPTASNPTYIKSSAFISEPIIPFNGIDHEYTPEKYLQHIKERVTFSLGLQPANPLEYKFWHIRRLVFLQCSLTSTVLSWVIRLNNTFKQDGSVFVQAFKITIFLSKTAYYVQVETLNLVKKTLGHFVTLP